jgi:hypothetical protein
MKSAAQLIMLRNSLRGHAAENDLLPIVICDLSEQDLERAHLIMSNRSDMAAIDGKLDRFRFYRGWFRHLRGRDDFLFQLAPTRTVRWRAVFTEGMSSSGKNSDSSVRTRRYGSEAPIFATTRSHSGVHRSGMISLTGLRVWRRVTAQRHGSNRGAETFTAPNKEKRRRGRLSLMGRGAPHRWHRRRGNNDPPSVPERDGAAIQRA